MYTLLPDTINYSGLLDSLNCGVLCMDQTDTVVYLNHRAEEILIKAEIDPVSTRGKLSDGKFIAYNGDILNWQQLGSFSSTGNELIIGTENNGTLQWYQVCCKTFNNTNIATEIYRTFTFIYYSPGQALSYQTTGNLNADIFHLKDTGIRVIRQDDIINKMIESVQDYAIIFLDRNGVIQNWNKGAEKIKGYKPEEIIGKKFHLFYKKEDQADFLPEHLMEVALKEGQASQEGWRVKKDGSLFWASVLLSAVYDDEKNLMGFSKVTKDITQKKNTEDLLRQSENQFKGIVSNVPGVIYQWFKNKDGSSGFGYVSPALMDYFGVPPEEMFKIVEMIHPDDKLRWRQSIHQANQNNTPWDFKGRLLYPDGTIKWWSGRSVLSDRTEQALVYNGIMIDITKEKEAESAFNVLAHRFTSFMKHTPVMAWIVDKKGVFHYLNPVYLHIFRLPEDTIGKSFHDIFPEKIAEEYQLNNNLVFDSGMPIETEENSILPDGTRTFLKVFKFPVGGGKGERLLGGIALDITPLKESEINLKQMNEQLVLSNRELEQFAYIASHDLQEPLRTITSFLQLFERKYKGRIDTVADQYISFAVKGAERLKRLIQDILQYSRIADLTEKKGEKINTQNLVNDIVSRIDNSFSQANVKFIVGTLPDMYGITTKIEQLFQNLIDNAIKYRGEADPLIEIGGEKKETGLLFYVKDNGIGIDKMYLDQIFIIFKRLHRKDEYEGTGIGLAICKKIVEQHNGEIWAESDLGKGSTFYFKIPESFK